MKILFYKIAALLVFLGLFYELTSICTSWLLSEKNLKIHNADIKTIILGDSHAQYGLEDSVIRNSVNLANSDEPIPYTYYKLLTILNANPQIKNVVYSIGLHNLNSSMHNKFIADPNYTNFGLMTYYMLLDREGINDIKVMNAGENSIKQFLKYELYLKLKANTLFSAKLFSKNYPESFPFWRGAEPDEVGTLTLKEIKKHKHFYVNDTLTKTSDIFLKYLNKIAALCNEKGVELYLVSTPAYPTYYKNVPPALLTDFYKQVQEVQSKYQYVHYFDLYNFKFPDDSYYRDLHHINHKGAVMLSVKVNELIK